MPSLPLCTLKCSSYYLVRIPVNLFLTLFVQQLALESIRTEYANAQLECSAADERGKVLAAEVILLEDKVPCYLLNCLCEIAFTLSS
jgi:hypothetical protein